MSWRRFGGFGALAAVTATGAGIGIAVAGDLKSNTIKAGTPSTKPTPSRETKLNASVERAIDLCDKVQRQNGLPGLSVAVAVDGNIVWRRGFGYADVENNIPMQSDTVLRIASISKSITMAMLAAQMEEGKVDIDLPLDTYLPDFPKKKWEGLEVPLTVRHFLSHLSGIRHYRKKEDMEKTKESETTDSDYAEFFSKIGCDSVTKAMEMFQNDELIHKPGTKYFYTTHGWTVVSAVIEKVVGTSFETHAKRMFQFWGLQNTHLDEHDPIIMNRGRYYRREKKESQLINAHWVDNSCKWAGGGFLSTVDDLIKFSHIMMYSAQQSLNPDINGVKAFLKRDTIQKLWTGDKATSRPYVDNLYGLGWVVGEPFANCVGCNSRDEKFVAHSGGAVGASSILYIHFPPPEEISSDCVGPSKGGDQPKVKGVVVAMITNLQDVGLSSTAKKLAKEFEWIMPS